MFLSKFIFRGTAVRCGRALKLHELQTITVFLKKYKSTGFRTSNKYQDTSGLGFDDSETEKNDGSFPEPHPYFFEKSYDKKIQEEKAKRSSLWKKITKKKYFKEPKQPKMLTWNEVQQIKFLYKSDPEEWTAEKLSESFPVLPQDVLKLLKASYSEPNVDKVKKRDLVVLNNWYRFMNNELNAKPELLKHLKKFTNRYENLKVQLQDPSYYKLPEPQNEPTWGTGEMSKMLARYEREVEELRAFQLENLGINSEPAKIIEEGDLGTKNAMECRDQLEAAIEIERKSQNITNEDTFVINKNKGFSEAPMTLENLKTHVIEKADSSSGSLTLVENMVLDKALEERSRSKSPTLNYIDEEDVVNNEKLTDDRNYVTIEQENVQTFRAPKVRETNWSRTIDGSSTRRTRASLKQRENVPEPIVEEKQAGDTGEVLTEGFPMDEDTMFVNENNLHLIYENQGKSEKQPVTEIATEKRKKKKTPVDYYGTEKDKIVYENYQKLLSNTSFWNTSADEKSVDNSIPSQETPSPHGPVNDNYFCTNKYPQKIRVPKGQGKNVLFKVKDCYYDYEGKFLYRVPGMTE